MKNRVRPRCLNLVSFPVIFATVHTIVYYLELVQLKSEKSEDLEYLAVINYEDLECLAIINYEDLEIMRIFAALNY